MEMKNLSFDEIIGDYSNTWFRASIVDAEDMYPIVTEWCKSLDSIKALNSLIDNINHSSTKLHATLQSMKVRIIKGVEYGIIEDEEES